MSELPTSDQLAAIFSAALKAGDTQGVGDALRIMALVDPERAGLLFDTLRVALAIAQERDAASVRGRD